MIKMSSLSYFVLTLSILLNVILLAPSAFGQSQLTSDFGINVTSADDLTFTGFRNLPDNPPGETTITFAYVQEFPALAGQGVGGAFLKFGPNGINSLHNHPRGSEVLFVLSGSIVAGLVDTSNRLYTQTLQAGDAFLFPIGLTHFQINYNKEPATALAAFSNPNAGRTSLPPAIFNSNPRIDAGFLEDALALDAKTVERLLNTPFPSVYGGFSRGFSEIDTQYATTKVSAMSGTYGFETSSNELLLLSLLIIIIWTVWRSSLPDTLLLD